MNILKAGMDTHCVFELRSNFIDPKVWNTGEAVIWMLLYWIDIQLSSQ